MRQLHRISVKNDASQPLDVGVEPSGWYFDVAAGRTREIYRSTLENSPVSEIEVSVLEGGLTFSQIQVTSRQF